MERKKENLPYISRSMFINFKLQRLSAIVACIAFTRTRNSLCNLKRKKKNVHKTLSFPYLQSASLKLYIKWSGSFFTNVYTPLVFSIRPTEDPLILFADISLSLSRYTCLLLKQILASSPPRLKNYTERKVKRKGERGGGEKGRRSYRLK